MEYTAVIRTLGKAGEKYRTLLDSLFSQTMPPKEVIVYIAEGYPLPEEASGAEKYVYVKKGMTAQRALDYDEVKTEYILLLDDDLYLAEDAVEEMAGALAESEADVVSPDVYANHKRSRSGKLMMFLSGRMRPRRDDGKWGYKVMRDAGYSYNSSPSKKIYLSQTNAGACCLCRKKDFLRLHFEDELWLDDVKYPLGEDQTMYYKMYLSGLKQITLFTDKVVHLDGGTSMLSSEKEKLLVYSDFRFKLIFWHRFIFLPDSGFMKIFDIMCIMYMLVFGFIVSTVKLRFDILAVKFSSVRDTCRFIRGRRYMALPRITPEI